MSSDLVIRNGLVIDGSGGEPFEADVAVNGSQIAAVGRQLPPGREEIDARHHIVTPGFVDIHSHYDGQVLWENRLSPSSDHGVTTTVMGNCAIGFAPCRPADRTLLAQVVAGVEDIPEAVMMEGLPWNWETFPEYLDALRERRCDIDFAAQVPHSAVRVFVMGQRGADREPASRQELAQMTEIVREGIAAGAIGVSSSHTLIHRRLDGVLAPCETASESELLALARGIREAGRGVFELVIDFSDVTPGGSTEFEMLKRIAAATGGRSLSYSLVERPSDPEAWKTLLTLTEQANKDGIRINAQIAPRAVGMCFGLDLPYNPFSFHPSYAAISHLPLNERIDRMRDPTLRAKILGETAVGAADWFTRFKPLFPTMFELSDPPDYEPPPQKRIYELAAARSATQDEVLYDLLVGNGGRALLYLAVLNATDGTLSTPLKMMRSDATIIALGDGGAHYGLICDAGYPTFSLVHWVRDRKGERLPLPWMINALSRKPALAVEVGDRGLVAPGFKADLNVIDFDRLGFHRPEVRHDLPARGRRIVQRASGYSATIVSGQVTYRNGEGTGALPGRLVRPN